jgi:hypothetical protein
MELAKLFGGRMTANSSSRAIKVVRVSSRLEKRRQCGTQ